MVHFYSKVSLYKSHGWLSNDNISTVSQTEQITLLPYPYILKSPARTTKNGLKTGNWSFTVNSTYKDHLYKWHIVVFYSKTQLLKPPVHRTISVL